MKIATFQFRGSSDIASNLAAIQRGIEAAAAEGTRFLLTQECALCGYPPIETPDIHKIDYVALERAIQAVQELACLHGIYVALGTILPQNEVYTNSLLLLSPDRASFPTYHKRALWGWEQDQYVPGTNNGIYTLDGMRIGLRICFEVRFPEYFRELFQAGVQVACVSLCDNQENDDPERYQLIQAHLMTRAVENSTYVISSNTISKNQTAPTAIIDPDGKVLQVAPTSEEALLLANLCETPPNFGRQGRIQHSRELLQRVPGQEAVDSQDCAQSTRLKRFIAR